MTRILDPMTTTVRLALRSAVVGMLAVALAGCGNQSFDDLQTFVETVDQQPRGQIPPLPPFVPYKPFNYRAADKRSPFEPPVIARPIANAGPRSNIKPKENRVKEFLEQFPIGQLRMVGTLEQFDSLFALVRDPDGGVHRVIVGDYLGTDHGQIEAIDDTAIDLVEIVPDGTGGWVQRARTVALAGGER